MKKIISLFMAIAVIISSTLAFNAAAFAAEDFTPEAPSDLDIVQISKTSLKISWYSSAYNNVRSENFEISKYNKSTKKYIKLGTMKANSEGGSFKYTICNLKEATKYTIAVRAFNKVNGKTYYSDYSELLYVSTAPKDTTLKSVKYLSKGKIKVCWSKVSSATGYLIEYCTNKKFKNDGTTCYVKAGKNDTSKTISNLANKTYYVRIRAYIYCKDLYYCSDYSNVKSTKVKSGASVKEMLNGIKTSADGAKFVKNFTENGVDTNKYSSTYSKIKAIYDWHSKHNTDYGWSCVGCNTNFAVSVAELLRNQKKYELFIYLACDNFKNNDGSVVMHKWCVIYLAGVPYIFDPRLQGYTGNKTGTTYFGISPTSSVGKNYLFDGWYNIFPTTFEDCDTYDYYMPYYSFPFVPSVKKPAVVKPTATSGKSTIKLKWSKVSKADGYQIQYSTSSSFSSYTSLDTDKNTLEKTIKGLKSGKTYYVRIRAYKQIGNSKIKGNWCDTIKIKTK